MRTRAVVCAVVLLGIAATAGGLALWVARTQAELDIVLPALDASRPRPQGGYYVGASSEPEHLNPLTTSDAVARSLILRYTHDSLLDRDPVTGELCPAVAESVQLEPGGGALSVRLRDGVRFEDGEALSVDDLEFVFAAAKASGATLGSAREVFDLLRGFERQDARSFRLLVATPHFKVRGTVGIGYPVLQAKAWRAAIAALSARDGVRPPAEGTPAWGKLLARVRLPGPGTGAYALARDRRTGDVAWRRGVDILLVQNPMSWRRGVQPEFWNLMGIRVRFLTDAAARLAELRAGRLDWYIDDDAESALAQDSALQRRMRLLEYRWPRLGHHMVVWNLRRKPYDDVRVRRALSMLFDRQAIVDKFLTGHGRPAAAWFRPDDPEYPPDLAPVAFDPAAARALLQECGVVRDGAPAPKVTIFVANEMPLQRRILEAAVQPFATAGLDLVIERRDWGDVVQRRETRDFDGVLMIWSHEPWIDPFANFHSSQSDPPGKNYSGLRDPGVDQLLEVARAEFDDRARADKYRQLAHRLRDLEPVSLLVHPLATLLIDQRFQCAEPGALGVVVDRFWIAQ